MQNYYKTIRTHLPVGSQKKGGTRTTMILGQSPHGRMRMSKVLLRARSFHITSPNPSPVQSKYRSVNNCPSYSKRGRAKNKENTHSHKNQNHNENNSRRTCGRPSLFLLRASPDLAYLQTASTELQILLFHSNDRTW